jgi:nucleoside-diphosphate-sugar epimerase
MIKTVLILGSAGQVGGHLTSYLTKKGYSVLEYDIATNAIEDLRVAPSVVFESLVMKSDFVFFLAFDAGGSHYLETYQDTFEFIDNNLRIVVNTISTLKKCNKPFLFASSQMSNMSQSTYGLLKAIGERHTRAVGGKIVKFWNVYGHESDITKFHVISDFIKMASENGQIRMRTQGLETRDFLYADDCCEGLETIMLNYESIPDSEELHLAKFEWNSILEVAQIIGDVYRAEIIPGESSDNIQLDIKNIPNKYLLNLWQPKTKLKDGILKVIELQASSR